MPGFGEVAAAWPLGVALAVAMAARELFAGRRRAALNEAVHELRRPLQALALAGPPARQPLAAPVEGSLQLAATALERLEREINGDPAAPVRVPVDLDALLVSAVARWRSRAALGGGSLVLGPRPAGAVALGDRCRLAQAIDNLIVNAIEHGGPDVVVSAELDRDRLRIAIADRGHADPRPGRPRARSLPARFSGRSRRGHGLRVVRRTAAEHGGGFRLHHRERGADATLELPLAPPAGDRGQAR